MITKKCAKCKIEKPVCDFDKNIYYKDSYTSYCKICRKEYNKKYRDSHQEEIKKYRLLNREKHKEVMKKWHNDNKEKEKEYGIKYRERKNYLQAKRRKENPQKNREWNREYQRKRRKNELNYTKDRIRNMVSYSFKRKGYTKKSKTYKILGAEYNIVWEYLKNTWFINYGKKYNGEDYEIDHIIPLATAKTEEEIIKLCHYTNLQLLTPEDNLKKGNSIIKK